MKIKMAKNAGACYGVEMAFDAVIEASEKAKDGEKVHTLGQIIHNAQAVEWLRRDYGVSAIQNLDETDSGTILIRSHGAPPEIFNEANKKGLNIVDATCPFVIRSQEHALDLMNEGYFVVVLGEKKHPEVIGILGQVGDRGTAIETIDDLETNPIPNKVGVVLQSTQKIEKFNDIILELFKRCFEVRIKKTICNVVAKHQKSATELAQEVDVMIVIGGKNSANTKELAMISEEEGAKAYHIETAEELQETWFQGCKNVGITAGTSTPSFIIESILSRLKQIQSKIPA